MTDFFAQDVAAGLEEMRALSESLMVDECRIERRVVDESGQPVYVPGPDRRLTESWQVVYEGPCKVRAAGTQAVTAEAGEVVADVSRSLLDLPVSDAASGLVRAGDRATVTESRFDPANVGRVLIVQRDVPRTYPVERRLACEEVSGVG